MIYSLSTPVISNLEIYSPINITLCHALTDKEFQQCGCCLYNILCSYVEPSIQGNDFNLQRLHAVMLVLKKSRNFA